MTTVSSGETICRLSELLKDGGYVGPDFASAVCAREEMHPTGLPTVPVGVAIPHTEAHHVYRSAIAIGVLAAPVQFGEMGRADGASIPVRIVFLLAIRETEKQVSMIRDLTKWLQTPDLLRSLTVVKDAAEVMSLLVPDDEYLELASGGAGDV